MMRKLHHPLWAHIPAAILLAIIVGVIINAGPMLHQQVPIHYGPTGIPDGFGSAWEAVAAILISALMFIGISFAIDEDWARRETRKSFNWMSLLDELTVGIIAAFAVGYFDMVGQRISEFSFPWPLLIAFTGGGVIFAAILEWRRPWNPDLSLAEEDVNIVAEDVHTRIASGKRWVYSETQNPLWVSIVIVCTSLLMLAFSVDYWSTNQLYTLVLLVPGLAVYLLWGGLYVAVTADDVIVKLGLLGVRLLRMRVSDIVEASVLEFSPLADFGGYGIRFNRNMIAFFFRGNRGVKLRNMKGRQFLIGSDHPERLAAVIHKAMEGKAEVLK